jgi:hypothetical protein
MTSPSRDRRSQNRVGLNPGAVQVSHDAVRQGAGERSQWNHEGAAFHSHLQHVGSRTLEIRTAVDPNLFTPPPREAN